MYSFFIRVISKHCFPAPVFVSGDTDGAVAIPCKMLNLSPGALKLRSVEAVYVTTEDFPDCSAQLTEQSQSSLLLVSLGQHLFYLLPLPFSF